MTSTVEMDKLIDNLYIGTNELRTIREDTFLLPAKNHACLYEKPDTILADAHSEIQNLSLQEVTMDDVNDKRKNQSRPQSKSKEKRAKRHKMKQEIAKKTLGIKNGFSKNNVVKREDRIVRRKLRNEKSMKLQRKYRLKEDLKCMKQAIQSFKI